MNFAETEAIRHTEEFARILNMPRRTWTEADLEVLTDRMTALLRTPNGTQRLFPIQALALYELGITGGLFGGINVGRGKELICFLAGRVLRAKHPLLIMPAHLVKRSRDTELAEYGVNWRVSKNLRILSYQILGGAAHDKDLEIVPPDLWIFNEVQRIKNANAAVTRRIHRHMKKAIAANDPEFPIPKVVAVTGTPVAQGIEDFAPVVRWCMPQNCPLPDNWDEIRQWAQALDEKPGSFQQREPGALLELCTPEELKQPRQTAARMGFRRRLTETVGFVSTLGEDDLYNKKGDAIGLTVRAIQYEQDPVVEKHYKKLREDWETPSGWAFSMAMGVWRHARTLALGIHYDWDPPPEGGPDGPWCLARRAWKKFVRESIRDSREPNSLDSELQVANECLGRWQCIDCGARGKGQPATCTKCEGVSPLRRTNKGALDNAVFNAWREIEPSYRPVSRAVIHDDAALRECQKWMAQGPGVVFTDHTFFAEELARRTGARYFGAGGIDKTGLEIEKADPNSCVIASRVANSTGRNIQFWSRGLVASSPHNSLEWEQMLGRFHRTGQQKDVHFDLLLGCAENYEGWVRALALAKMTHDTLGSAQKLLLARAVGIPSACEMETRSGFKWQRTVDRT